MDDIDKHDIHTAVGTSNLAIVKRVFARDGDGIVNSLDFEEKPPLHYAAGLNKDTEIAEYLLKKGANVNAIDKVNKKTALHTCFGRGKVRMSLLLLENGAEKEPRDKRGKTPLDHAKKFKQKNIVDFFNAYAVGDKEKIEAIISLSDIEANNRARKLKDRKLEEMSTMAFEQGYNNRSEEFTPAPTTTTGTPTLSNMSTASNVDKKRDSSSTVTDPDKSEAKTKKTNPPKMSS